MIRVENLKKWFPLSKGLVASLLNQGAKRFLKAADGVSFQIREGEILGLAGESGCGKTTVGMTTVRLYEPTSGNIFFDQENVSNLVGAKLRKFRENIQIIFQNPYESLNARFTVYDAVIEPLTIHQVGSARERKEIVLQTLYLAGLRPVRDYIQKFPHELSGGQRQRVAIARGIVLKPKFVVADEPVSMLDVSIRAGILNLLKSFRDQMGLSILFISHDLSTIRYMCQKTAIMYMGKIIEIGPTEEVINRPRHPYTQALISAVPVANPDDKRERVRLAGEVSNPIDLPNGCRFAPRCSRIMDSCKNEEPPLKNVDSGHSVACHWNG